MSAHHRQDLGSLAVGGPTLRHAGSTPTSESSARQGVVIVLDGTPHEPTAYERWAKPTIDMLGAFTLIVLLAPVLLAVALGVRLTLGRGVLYRQQRVGRDGEIFTMFKFRSMVHDRRGERDERGTRDLDFVGEDRRRTHKHPEDPRVTSLGRFIRRYSLDELPQLFNVLRGELSLVGPRPELVEIVDRYEPWQHRRHDVKPGLTGLWQVTERDREGLMHLCVDTDLAYIDGVSLRADLRILALTVPAVLGIEPRTAASEIV